MASKKKKPEKKGATRFFLIVWLAAGLAFLALLGWWTESAGKVFATLDVEPPRLSMLMLSAGTWIGSGYHLLIATGVLAGSVLPFTLGMKGKQGLRLYAALAVLGLLAVFASWFGLKRQVDVISGAVPGTGHSAPR